MLARASRGPSILLVLIAGVAIAASASRRAVAQSAVPSDSVIHSIIKERVDAKRSSGLVVGAIDVGGARRVVAYGMSGPNDATPLDGNSVFEIGSITKVFTGALLADMVRRGEVKLDDPVAKYLPSSVKMPARGGQQITLVDLATQSSGLPRMPSNFHPNDASNPYAEYSVQQMYDFLSGYELPRDIGSKYEYSNLGVGLLGHALARRAGMSYEALVTARILDPLGMRDTRITLTPAMRSHLAAGHDAAGKRVANWDLPTLAGAGALRSTVNDMLKFLAANLDSASTPLGPTLHVTHVSRHATDNPALSLGLNWHILKAPSGEIVWHNGGTGGYRTYIGFDPVRRLGVVVLSNSGSSVDDIGMHLVDARLPLAPAPAPAKIRTEIALDAATLDAYVGEYAIAPAFSIIVSREGNSLFALATGKDKVQIYPESATDFFLKAVDAQLTFVKDSAGAVTGLVLHQAGSDTPGKKVK